MELSQTEVESKEKAEMYMGQGKSDRALEELKKIPNAWVSHWFISYFYEINFDLHHALGEVSWLIQNSRSRELEFQLQHRKESIKGQLSACKNGKRGKSICSTRIKRYCLNNSFKKEAVMKSTCLRFLFVAVILAGIIQCADIIAHAQDQTETIQLKQGTVTFNPPFEVTETMLYKDGGTIGIVIKDAKGISLPLCYDQRIKVPGEERFVYVGATHPNESSAAKVTRGSATEQALLRILTSAKIASPSPRIREDLVKAVIDKLGGTSKILIGK